MLKRRIYRNATTGVPKEVMFIESIVLDFYFFEILIRKNYIYENGEVKKVYKKG